MGSTCALCSQEFVKMARAMVNGSDVPPGPSPPELLSSQLSLLPGVVFDAVPIGKRFGDVIVDVKNTSIYVGDTVEVQFRWVQLCGLTE